MTPEQFFHGDPWLAKAYREKHKISQEYQNAAMWWQGVYVYEAVASVVSKALAKRGHKGQDYPQKPHELNPKDDDENKIEAERGRVVNILNSLKPRQGQNNGRNKRNWA